MTAPVNLKRIVKAYGDVQVVHGIDLDIKEGEFIVLLGPSGCGKTTTLRMVAGLEDISGGELKIGERLVNDVAPKDRKIAMVFQNYALYPNMTVRGNMAFAMKPHGFSKGEIEQKVQEIAGILGLEPLLDRKPAQLSGGQRQRVAMGRAMVRTPEVFLFDEPLSNLDAKLRTQMRMEIQKLHRRLKSTVLYVTHDQIEAMTLASRIVIMRDGRIEQVGTPKEVYTKPANVFVATFIGSPAMNLMAMRTKRVDNRLFLESGQLRFELPHRDGHRVTENKDVLVGMRPNYIRMVKPGDGTPEDQVFSARVEVVELLGAEGLLDLRLGDHEAIAQVKEADLPNPDDVIRVTFDFSTLHIFDAQTEQSIY